MASTETKVIVGIDFGTTYSGVAFTVVGPRSRPPGPPTPIILWPNSDTGPEGQDSNKVPTKIRYDGGRVQWGFSMPRNLANSEVKEGFKLGLEPGLLRQYDMPVISSGEAQTLTTDYMTALLEHTFFTLRRKIGDPLVDHAPFEFVVTVPAIWTERAKEATRRAARAATDKVGQAAAPMHLISEPEAAAMHALHGLAPHELAVGDTFMVCDAGGGTVDLITYSIAQLEPVFRLGEASPGSGEVCGSRFLDHEFRKFFTARFAALARCDQEVIDDAVQHFERQVKREFSLAAVASNRQFVVNAFGLDDDAALGLRRGRYHMDAADMFRVFEPVVSSVVRLVDDQVKAGTKDLKAVLLVGGFGASGYLRERLANHLVGVRVLQPPNSWLAVTLGAVMQGVAGCSPEDAPVSVASRRARKHYGLHLHVSYDAKTHAAMHDRRFWDARTGEYRVHVMDWFVERGQSVTERGEITTSCNIYRQVAEGPKRQLTLDILTDATNRQAPLLKDQHVAKLCTLEADLSRIPERSLAKSRGKDGVVRSFMHIASRQRETDRTWQMYYEYSFQVEVTILSASTQYRIVHDGKKYDIGMCAAPRQPGAVPVPSPEVQSWIPC